MWESPAKFLFPGEQHPWGPGMKQTPPSPHSLSREKCKFPHVWFHPWQQKSKFGSSRAGAEGRREDFLFQPSQFLSFSWQKRKNFPTFSKRVLGKVFTNCQLSPWHWLLNQSLQPINLLLQILQMKLGKKKKRANGRRMIHGFVFINIQIVRDPNKVREFQCRNFKGE